MASITKETLTEQNESSTATVMSMIRSGGAKLNKVDEHKNKEPSQTQSSVPAIPLTNTYTGKKYAVPTPPSQADKNRKEILIQSKWDVHLDTSPPTPILNEENQDHQQRPFPEETFVLDSVFSQEECARLLNSAEEAGFGTTNYNQSYRGNLRLITTDAALTERLWERIKAFVPSKMTDKWGSEWVAVGLNERCRLSKYYPGDRFQMHEDAQYIKSDKVRSHFTVNIYMNGGFEGGQTRFYYPPTEEDPITGRWIKGDVQCAVVPAPGRCLIFRQPPEAHLLHDGEELGSGVKYLLRSDVMYKTEEDKGAAFNF